MITKSLSSAFIIRGRSRSQKTSHYHLPPKLEYTNDRPLLAEFESFYHLTYERPPARQIGT